MTVANASATTQNRLWCVVLVSLVGEWVPSRYQDGRPADRDQTQNSAYVIAFAISARMELRQLATFVAVAEEGSFTRAADRLHVVQSAVSAGVRNLEKELGTMLFDRSTHSVKLTDAGHALYPKRARRWPRHRRRVTPSTKPARPAGTVVLGTMQAQGMRAIDLAAILAAFRAEHHAVEVEDSPCRRFQPDGREVREGRLDLAFVALPGTARPASSSPYWQASRSCSLCRHSSARRAR